MKPIVQSYLFFGGRTEEALEFYKSALGAEVTVLMRHRDSPEPPPPGRVAAGFEDKVLHASFTVGQTQLMASDGCGESPSFDGFCLSLGVGTEAEAEKCFNALAVGGEITMPLAKTFWSPRFGMLKDQFGLGWMVSVLPPDQHHA